MTNELQKIKAGAKAKSSVLNDNFEYLDSRITTLDTKVDGNAETAALNLENTKKNLNKNINKATSKANNAQTTADSALSKAKSGAETQWKWKTLEIINQDNVAGKNTSYTKSLSSYLDNDGKMYEIYVHGYMRDESDGDPIWCHVSSTSFGGDNHHTVAYAQLVVEGSADISTNDFILQAKSTDTIFYRLSDNVDHLTLRILGYKRINTI